MPTFLNSFVNTELKVRYKEPYLTEGLNEKQAIVQPRGIYRGFRLTTHGSALTVTVSADPDASDHVAIYETADGYALRILRDSGDFSLDLSSLINKVIVLAIYADYTLNQDTTGEIRAYEFLPVDEFTIATEYSELIVLGTVIVPGAGVIPATSISPWFRTSAWENKAIEHREAEQVLRNGDFVLGSTAAPSTDDILWPYWDYTDVTETNLAFDVTTVGGPQVGSKHLRMVLTGAASQIGILPHEGVYPVREGDYVKVEFWIKGSTLAPGPGLGGHMGVRVLVSSDFPDDVIQTEYFELLTLSGTFAYTHIERVFNVRGSTARFLRLEVYYDDNSNSSTGTVYFDGIRVWIHQPALDVDSTIGRPRMSEGALIARTLDIAPLADDPASHDEWLEKLLTLRFKEYSGGAARYNWQLRKDAGAWLLRFITGTLQVDDYLYLLGSNRIGSAAEGALPRVHMPIPAFGTARYVLLYQADNTTAGNPHLRVYASDQTTVTPTQSALIITVNALWTGTQWNRDTAGQHSFMAVFKPSSISYYYYQSGSAAPWVDANWNNGTDGRILSTLHQDITTLESLLELLGQIKIGAALIGSNAEAVNPRLITPLPDAAGAGIDYTLVWEGDASGVAKSSTRLYATTANPFTVGFGLVLVTNATWDGAQWTREVAGNSSTRIDIAPGGSLKLRYVPSTAGSPWVDAAWDNPTGIDTLELQSNTSGAFGDNAALFLQNARMQFIHSAGRTNPAIIDAPLANTLYALSMPKAWGIIESGTPVNPTILDSFNVNTVAYSGNDIRVFFHTAMNAPPVGLYAVVFGMWDSAPSIPISILHSDTDFYIQAFDTAGAPIDLTVEAIYIMFAVFARQNS